MARISKAELSRAMAAIARKRKPDQRKGGRPKSTDRCECGRYTKTYALTRNHRCAPKAKRRKRRKAPPKLR